MDVLVKLDAETRLPPDESVRLPAATRERLGWAHGTELQIIEGPGSITLRPYAADAHKRLSADEAFARIRARNSYSGPPISLEQMDAGIAEMFRRKHEL